jgi:hypothetical protein
MDADQKLKINHREHRGILEAFKPLNDTKTKQANEADH